MKFAVRFADGRWVARADAETGEEWTGYGDTVSRAIGDLMARLLPADAIRAITDALRDEPRRRKAACARARAAKLAARGDVVTSPRPWATMWAARGQGRGGA